MPPSTVDDIGETKGKKPKKGKKKRKRNQEGMTPDGAAAAEVANVDGPDNNMGN